MSTTIPEVTTAKPRKANWRRRLAVPAVVLLLLATWAGIDLFGPRTSHLKEFDADEVARLETDMWRSYYDKRQVALFFQLAELLRKQYNMP
ncbi:MAG TPA: hypothetical protein VGN90_18080, partial [Pyrinomonadaceae bacterium]|nr:hypothetical protein [Pyrinomonadaceae bacterium]